MFVRFGLIWLVGALLCLAEESTVDHHGEQGCGNYPTNVISTDYAEISIIEEVPNDGVHSDQSKPYKVKVHKSFHRKHKKLPQVMQPRDNQKIEDISVNNNSRKSKGYSTKKLTDAEILAQLQKSVSYQWWLETSAQEK